MNFKRKFHIILIILTMLLGMMALGGCATEIAQEDEEKVEIFNAGQLGQDLGIVITLPASIENAEFYILEENLGEIAFSENGIEFKCLVEEALGEANLYEVLNGTGGAFSIVETGLEGETSYTLMTNTGFINVVNWYDGIEEAAYTLYTEGQGLDKDTLEMAKKIIAAQTK